MPEDPTATITELIEAKRDGGRLSELAIASLIGDYTRGAVPEYQMAALLMAIYHQGLDVEETAAWTEAMLHSGEVLDFSHIAAAKVDKHSTGGVGDKVSISLAPLVASAGVVVPMMSGRGLAHTGGTVDKLESIPGFNTSLGPEEFTRLVTEHGLVIAGQSDSLAPADRRIYALRDTTGTVPSIPLIASSIMSKKLAEGIDGLVLDVKVGAGAFMTDMADARALAETMVGIGRSHGTAVVAFLTALDQPLGNAVGNAVEIAESIEMLRGNGPDDLAELVMHLGAEMLMMGGEADDAASAHERLSDAIDSGRALAKFTEIVEAQGGDPAVIDDASLLPRAASESTIKAQSAGWIEACDALAIGRAGVRLGAGRARKEDRVDPGVGFTIHAKAGDRVEEGDALVTVHWSDEGRFRAAADLLAGAWQIGPVEPPKAPLVLEEVR